MFWISSISAVDKSNKKYILPQREELLAKILA
jgi:hypothetical protein